MSDKCIKQRDVKKSEDEELRSGYLE
jgi:hypothetical protein